MEKQMNPVPVFNPFLSANVCYVLWFEDCFTSGPLGKLLWGWTKVMGNPLLALIKRMVKQWERKNIDEEGLTENIVGFVLFLNYRTP